jgi:hypothetical protein
MMERLIARGEAIARAGQQRQIAAAASQLRGLFGAAAVDVEDSRIVVRGRRLIARWLIDPVLRFFGRGQQ